MVKAGDVIVSEVLVGSWVVVHVGKHAADCTVERDGVWVSLPVSALGVRHEKD